MYHYGAVEADTGEFDIDSRAAGGQVSRQAKATAGLSASRVMDVLIALAVVLFTLPLLVLIAVTIKLHDGGPALFGHTRIGRGGRNFRCLKFRSMVVDAEVRLQALLAADPSARREWEADQKLRDDPRVTPLGAFLRKTSLDELPQVFNVLRGEMSIVGPRPIVQSEVCRYGRAFKHYCSVPPGITGLWQVSGRNDVSYRRRVALDRVYAKSKCLRTDLMIIAKTVPAVLLRSGSY